MSRRTSRRGPVALVALAGGAVALGIGVSSNRFRTAVRDRLGGAASEPEPRAPMYVVLPDRPAGGDRLAGAALAEGAAAGAAIGLRGTASGMPLGAERF